MKLSIPLSLSAVAVLLTPDAAAQRGRDRMQTPDLRHLTFSRETFESAALGGRDVPFGIYLPKDYAAEENAEKTYPLVIWLHGMFEDERRFHGRGGGAVLDEMTGKGTVPEMIFVCANGGRSSFYLNGVVEDSAYEDMVREELVGHVEKNYRVAKERGRRAIAGVSMGGYGALKIAFKNPRAFGVVAAHSAALLTRDPDELEEKYRWLRGGGKAMLTALFGDPVDKEKWADENVLVLVESLDADDLAGLKIYFDCGDSDRYQFDGANAELHELLAEREIPHTWRLVEGGNHGWRSGYNQSAVPHSLRFIAEQFAAAATTAGDASADKDPGKGR